MKLERLLIGGLFFTCALTLASRNNSKPEPEDKFATITVIDGTGCGQYSGITLQQVEDDYVRMVCDLDELVTIDSSKVPTEKIDMFFVHAIWGDKPTGYIDFDLSDAPGIVRGEKFIAGTDKSITFDKIEVTETVIVDFKFTSGAGTYLNFFIGNSANDWSKYNGYYKLFPNATIAETEPGISIDVLEDGYIRLTLDLDALTKTSETGAPTPAEGYNLFYIHGGWTTGEGYVDFNPVIS